ncbi:hypothetical protein F2P46_06665 [Massilia sp. CCM 8734]|nr:hypothetical protein [Massilia sp. CCM 8734]
MEAGHAVADAVAQWSRGGVGAAILCAGVAALGRSLLDGAGNFCVIRSCIDTLRKQSHTSSYR